MFYLLLALVLIVLGIVCAIAKRNIDAFDVVLILAVSGIVVCVPFASGLQVYPKLVGLKAEVTVLETEIETVKGAHYTVKSGNLVGGSLDNLKQSTILSEYITTVARKKATYNKELVRAQIRKNLAMFRWFADGFYISGEVNNLTLLGSKEEKTVLWQVTQ